MIVLAGLYDPDIPPTENAAYMKKAREVIKLQEELMEQGPDGFGRLKQKLIELGQDPSEVVNRYQQEASQ